MRFDMKSVSGLIVAAILATNVHATPADPELDAIATRLASRAQLDVGGEQASFSPPDAAVARQYDTFRLRFDRPTKRMRLSYSRFQNRSTRIDVEAWGTLDCLNMLRIEKTPPGLVQPTIRSCSNLSNLYSVLSDNSGGYAPNAILQGEIEGQLIAHELGQPNARLSTSHPMGSTLLTGTYVDTQPGSGMDKHVWHYWLNEEATALVHTDVENDQLRVRTNFRHSEPAFVDSDFEYTINPEAQALLDFSKSPNAQAKDALKRLADQGSLAAKLQLLLSEPNVAALAFGGGGTGSPDEMWKNATVLGDLGMSAMYTVQGQVLARMPASAGKLLPARFQGLDADQRKLEAQSLVWKGAKGCDPTAQQEARSGLMMGGDIFDPNPLKQRELETIMKQCDKDMTAPELTSAASRFADPWPPSR